MHIKSRAHTPHTHTHTRFTHTRTHTQHTHMSVSKSIAWSKYVLADTFTHTQARTRAHTAELGALREKRKQPRVSSQK